MRIMGTWPCCLSRLPLLTVLACLLHTAVRGTEALAAAGHSDSLLTSLIVPSEYSHHRQSRDANYEYPSLTSSSAASASQKAVYPFDYSTAGISRTLYPSYFRGLPVYPKPSGVGYSVPNGASPVQQVARSYTPYGSNTGGAYSAYNPSYSNGYNTAPISNTGYNAVLPSAASRSLYTSTAQQPRQQQASLSLRSNLPYGYSPNPYNSNYYSQRNNQANYALSYRSADPTEPEDPDTDSSSKKQFMTLSMAPQLPQQQQQQVQQQQRQQSAFLAAASQSIAPVQTSNSAAITAAASQLTSSSASDLAAFTARGLGGGSSGGYGVGSGYAAAVPDGATYSGPSSTYAQNSPNTKSGSLYNPNYSKPNFYGHGAGLGGGISSAALLPFFLYYPVQYGYDQGEQSVMPTGGYFPLIGYKRRYGYRNGPYYGYGIYVDYPPYFGFGKVKDGFGSDPEADAMASIALAQGSGASESLNSGAGQASGYGQPGASGYGSQPSSSGYGASPSTAAGYGSQAGTAGYGGQSASRYGSGGASAGSYASPVSGYNSGSGSSNPTAYSGQLGAASSGSYSPSAYQTSQYPGARSYMPSSNGYTAALPLTTGQTSQYGATQYGSAAARSYLPATSVASPSAYSSSYRQALPASSASQYRTA